jgi:hypothetical protein
MSSTETENSTMRARAPLVMTTSLTAPTRRTARPRRESVVASVMRRSVV